MLLVPIINRLSCARQAFVVFFDTIYKLISFVRAFEEMSRTDVFRAYKKNSSPFWAHPPAAIPPCLAAPRLALAGCLTPMCGMYAFWTRHVRIIQDVLVHVCEKTFRRAVFRAFESNINVCLFGAPTYRCIFSLWSASPRPAWYFGKHRIDLPIYFL